MGDSLVIALDKGHGANAVRLEPFGKAAKGAPHQIGPGVAENALGHDEIEARRENAGVEGTRIRKARSFDAQHVVAELVRNRIFNQPGVRLDAEIALGLQIGNKQAAEPQAAAAEIQCAVVIPQPQRASRRNCIAPMTSYSFGGPT
ncbi:MAG TPA: hypothetical protein VHW69_06855 [Rhizomicrobium sp.]|nr:hypothetical protein [Rhizomicrobium sp.]